MKCKACNGTGWVYTLDYGSNDDTSADECDKCLGTGDNTDIVLINTDK